MPWIVTVNQVVQFHAWNSVSGQGVDNKVTWLTKPWKSTLDPLGSIDQTGKFTAPTQPSAITLEAGTVLNVPEPYIGTKNIEVVAAPLITSLSAFATTISAGQSVSLTPIFMNGQGKLLVGASVVQATLISGTPVAVTPAVSTTYSLVVTRAAGAVVGHDLRITVQ